MVPFTDRSQLWIISIDELPDFTTAARLPVCELLLADRVNKAVRCTGANELRRDDPWRASLKNTVLKVRTEPVTARGLYFRYEARVDLTALGSARETDEARLSPLSALCDTLLSVQLTTRRDEVTTERLTGVLFIEVTALTQLRVSGAGLGDELITAEHRALLELTRV